MVAPFSGHLEGKRRESLFHRGSLVGITRDMRRGSVLLDNRALHATTALKVRRGEQILGGQRTDIHGFVFCNFAVDDRKGAMRADVPQAASTMEDSGPLSIYTFTG